MSFNEPYAPEVDGEPDPGEVVWAWVAYEDDPSQGKDRPVLVLRAEGDGWVGLYLSSQDHDRDAGDEAAHGRFWMDVGSGGWDSQGAAERGPAGPAGAAGARWRTPRGRRHRPEHLRPGGRGRETLRRSVTGRPLR